VKRFTFSHVRIRISLFSNPDKLMEAVSGLGTVAPSVPSAAAGEKSAG
jgi:hypothetical protein